LAGSYFVEYLTDETEKRAVAIIDKIEKMGGIIRAIEEGYPQREIADSAYQYQREVEKGERLIVGVNSFNATEHEPIPTLVIEDAVARSQLERLNAVKRSRNSTEVDARLRAVEDACKSGANLMPPVLAAVKAYATLGEISDVFRKVWGAYRETGTF
jgi:methylmalonyl-CoA mutase N-terminal domain/subunit